MPQVQITLLEGRTPEQKRRVAERITQTLVEEIGTNRENISIAFLEVTPASFSLGGMLMLDRKKSP